MAAESNQCHPEEWIRVRNYCRAPEAPYLENDISDKTGCEWDCLALPILERVRLVTRFVVLAVAQRLPLSAHKVWIYRKLGMRIGKGVYISPGVIIDPLFPELITLEDGALLGLGCRLLTHEFTTTRFRIGRVRIGQGTVIGGFATVRSGVSVGRRVTVGACSFVNADVDDELTVGGVPARPIKTAGKKEQPCASF